MSRWFLAWLWTFIFVGSACEPIVVPSLTGTGDDVGEGEGEGEGQNVGEGEGEPCNFPPPEPVVDVLDPMSATRLLRRASLTLTHQLPTAAQVTAVESAANDDVRADVIGAGVDDMLHDIAFYEATLAMARTWLHIPLTANDADEPEYGLKQQRTLVQCPTGTAMAGKWRYYRDTFLPNNGEGLCSGVVDGVAVREREVEPWWAEGTTVTLLGAAANESPTGQVPVNGNIVDIECRNRPNGTCGCGPAAVACFADPNTYPGWWDYSIYNPAGQRRLAADEPARWFAHLVWHDLPLTDLILSTRSVAPTTLQAAYVQQGLEGGAVALANDSSWWRADAFRNEPVDPLHAAGDPNAWREYEQPSLNPFFLEERDTQYDPRLTTAPAPGIPAAGMLTSVGFLGAYKRERLRAARMLEALACEELSPPSGGSFNAYVSDPATEGSCQHCHRRIDPAAIHFKRYGKAGVSFEGYGAQFFMPGVGDVWQWPARWRTGEYPYHDDPFAHWNRWYTPGTMMTPVTEVEAQANPLSVFIDFLPPDQTLLNQTSDGTIGPLGFAKLIVAAGAYDRCVVRQLHKMVIGRDIDVATESGYLDALTEEFVNGGRLGRPFIKSLTTSPLFSRGF
jgi:hypothetical protein